jgi:hypothetical protein
MYYPDSQLHDFAIPRGDFSTVSSSYTIRVPTSYFHQIFIICVIPLQTLSFTRYISNLASFLPEGNKSSHRRNTSSDYLFGCPMEYRGNVEVIIVEYLTREFQVKEVDQNLLQTSSDLHILREH